MSQGLTQALGVWDEQRQGCVRRTGVLRAFKGQVVRLLRHPSACAVVNELHVAASAKQRRALAAEFYSRQATLFQQARMHICTLQSPSGSTPLPLLEVISALLY